MQRGVTGLNVSKLEPESYLRRRNKIGTRIEMEILR